MVSLILQKRHVHFFTSQLSLFLMCWYINTTDDIIIEENSKKLLFYILLFRHLKALYYILWISGYGHCRDISYVTSHLLDCKFGRLYNIPCIGLHQTSFGRHRWYTGYCQLTSKVVSLHVVLSHWSYWKKVHKSPKRTQNSDYILHYTT
jgi:hypothetical protein